MYQVLARKYRPQTFDELVAQEHVRTTLENAIAQNRTAHGIPEAYVILPYSLLWRQLVILNTSYVKSSRSK